MSLYKELAYDTDIETVKGIQFGVLSPEEIVQRSVAEILSTETYQGLTSVVNGLFDPRMGVIDNNARCTTCEQKNSFCPGHFGHIVLAKPVYYVQFIGIINKILKCVCFRCSNLLIPTNSREGIAIRQKKGLRMKRFETICKLFGKTSKTRHCEVCGARQPDKIGKDGMNMFKITMTWNPSQKEVDVVVGNIGVTPSTPTPSTNAGGPTDTSSSTQHTSNITKSLSAEDVLRILQRISDEDADVMGFSPKHNRPEWMICTVLPVPPPAVRPSARNDTGQRMEDDITHKLSDIVKANDTLKQRIERGHAREAVENNVQFLQYHVATLVDNQILGMGPSMQRMGRPLRSIFDRLKSKEGRIRGNLMGKRVDYSARTVITPDPNISIDEIGVPIKIAMNLTFPEIVHPQNKAYLTDLVRRGADQYPGAKYIKKQNPYRTLRLKNMDTSEIELDIGDVVDRHLINGDYVLFNRQPSLHRMSMQGHRVRVMPFDTFRLNVCSTKAYNADFDGDEMNIHVPQSLQTRNELMQLASVPTQIISPKDCKPIVAVVQDVALGIYAITKKHVRLSEKQLFNLMCPNPTLTIESVPKSIEKDGNGNKLWTGRQLLSTIIPMNVNYRGENRSQDERNPDDENVVRIECGEILQGRIDTGVYQAASKGLVHAIYNEYGPDETRMFFDNTQQMVCNWLVYNGFSVGISDLVIPNGTQDSIKDTIRNMRVKVYSTIREIHENKFQNDTRKSNYDHFEEQVNSSLNNTVKLLGGTVEKSVDDQSNRMVNMIKSGSKGNPTNLSQMIACVGQQNVDGKRVAYGYEHRTLPHYTKYDDGPESRGFVENSFIGGLTPQEFFFHSMGGREGLIDTAVRTSESGYMQRKLVKAMEDCKVAFDMTVRTANGNIVQFLYGEDSMDPVKIEQQPLAHIRMDAETLERTYLLSIKDEYFLSNILEESTRNALFADSTWQDRCFAHYKSILEDRKYIIKEVFHRRVDALLQYPVSFVRILENTAAVYKKFNVAGVLSDLSPLYILDEIDKLERTVEVCRATRGNKLFAMLSRIHLSPKTILKKYGFDKSAFDQCILCIRARFYDSIINPSEMVGVVAAQSIGEPLSQLSVAKQTRVQIVGDSHYNGEIGDFVDGLLHKYPDQVVDLGHHSVVMDISHLDFKIMGVSEGEKTGWRTIAEISRHPANGQMVRVHTLSGKTTTATLSHSFLKRTENGIVPVLGSELVVGDRIPVAASLPQISETLASIPFDFGLTTTSTTTTPSPATTTTIQLTEALGISIGEYLMDYYDDVFEVDDISFVHRHFGGMDGHAKRIPAWVFASNLGFISGILRGVFPERSTHIYHNIPNEALADDLIVMLAFLGIFGTKSSEGNAKKCVINGYLFEHVPRYLDQIPCVTSTLSSLAELYPLSISTSCLAKLHRRSTLSRKSLIQYIHQFEEDANKTNELEMIAEDIGRLKQAADSDIIWDKIVKLEILEDPQEFVYDFTVPGNDSFMVDAGVFVHNTLNTFHNAGRAEASKTVRGMPRINELTRVTKNIKTPSMTLYLKPEFKNNKTRCMEIKNKIETTFFKDIVKSSKIYYDLGDVDTYIEDDLQLTAYYNRFRLEDASCTTRIDSPWLLRLAFDRRKMLDMDLTMIDLNHALMARFDSKDITCIFSDDNAQELVMRIRLYSRTDDDEMTELKAFESVLMENVIIKGAKGINRIEVVSDQLEQYDDATDTFQKNKEWHLETDGTSLLESLGFPWVDSRRSITNDVIEIYKVLGIEAARQALHNEISLVIAESKINYRHLSMLVDVMTMKGGLQPLDRFGINKNSDNGVLAKSSFEEVCDVLVKAGVFSELDKVNSVSANIMLGQISKCGTGDTEILMDEEIFTKFGDDGSKGAKRTMYDASCDLELLKFDFVLPDVDETIKKKNVLGDEEKIV
jgi:DNA-directed RNA polymerase beta' subunit